MTKYYSEPAVVPAVISNRENYCQHEERDQSEPSNY